MDLGLHTLQTIQTTKNNLWLVDLTTDKIHIDNFILCVDN